MAQVAGAERFRCWFCQFGTHLDDGSDQYICWPGCRSGQRLAPGDYCCQRVIWPCINHIVFCIGFLGNPVLLDLTVLPFMVGAPVTDAAAVRMARRRNLDFAMIRVWGTVAMWLPTFFLAGC